MELGTFARKNATEKENYTVNRSKKKAIQKKRLKLFNLHVYVNIIHGYAPTETPKVQQYTDIIL